MEQTTQDVKPTRSIPWLVWAVIGLLLVAGAVAFGLYHRQQSVSRDDALCSEETITKAAPLIESGKGAELLAIAQEVQALENYETDVNCLYIITSAYINISDAKNSRAYYDKLATTYDPAVGYSPLFGDSINSLATLESSVEFLEEQAKTATEGKFWGAYQ